MSSSYLPGSIRIHSILILVFLVAGTGLAQFPVQDMDRRSLGIEYSYMLRGQNITDAQVPSYNEVHQVFLGYAPVPYVCLQAGLGFDRFSVDPYGQTRFRGDFGLAPAFGVQAFSPFFANEVLRVSGGAFASFMSSSDNRGYSYSATVINPTFSLILSPSVFFDMAIGGRVHLIDGKMKAPRNANVETFANSDIGRGFITLILKSPFEKVFLGLDMDFSPSVNSDWSNGPKEARIGLTLGSILGWKGKSSGTKNEKPVYFPAYQEMKDRQEKMAEELE